MRKFTIVFTRPVMLMLLVLVFPLIIFQGCASTWDQAQTSNTAKGYMEYLKQTPKAEHADVALSRIKDLSIEEEKAAFQKAVSENTISAYRSFVNYYNFKLLRHDPRMPYDMSVPDKGLIYRYGAFEEEAKARITALRSAYKEKRCSDFALTSKFPYWLKQKDPNEPQRGDRITLESDLTLGPFDFVNDDPPITIEYRGNYIIYINGCGIIKGPDGTKVLVGYNCEAKQ